MSTYCSRMIWPSSSVYGTTVTVNGRVYTKGPGVFDAYNQDVAGLVTGGAVKICQSGGVPISLSGLTGIPAAPSDSRVSFSNSMGFPGAEGGGPAIMPDVAAPDPSRPVPLTIALTSATTSGAAILNFGSGNVPADVVTGMLVADVQSGHTTAITAGTTVSSINYGTGAVTMSANAAATTGGTDNITFTPASGTLYMDAALSRPVAWDGSYWRDVWSGAIS